MCISFGGLRAFLLKLASVSTDTHHPARIRQFGSNSMVNKRIRLREMGDEAYYY